ncbi:uncharacterized protein LOC8264753 [Ricinus communis]|uniref:Uncharacterized protein n=1 Tax=Ricinus communis TaxID=3988 RepID=B9SG96_RICCO|nr:uncharacterized protein LOC8264753 [Ricinus communis]EEF37342.1 conserved hypothetical protein [Ricinus communis]|eukprot:XP_002525015.1 uncharacterized protein LOC8264753 [Ricinus communis]
MTSVCISNCVNDARDPRVPVRATYVNLYKWPESDAEFIKSVRRVGQGLHGHYGQPRVVDSISCRQMYLRSYTFSRKESVPERTKKCIGRVKEKVANHGKKIKEKGGRRRNKCLVFRKVKEFSCNALFRIFHRLLSCGASVDVVDHND